MTLIQKIARNYLHGLASVLEFCQDVLQEGVTCIDEIFYRWDLG